MTDRRLNNLIVLNTPKDILDNINMSTMIQNWATLKERCINVQLLKVPILNKIYIYFFLRVNIFLIILFIFYFIIHDY